MAVLFTDVTERRRAEAAVRESEARFRGVLDGMTEGFGLLAPDFTILEHNAEALRMDGRPRDQIVGRSHWEAYPGSQDSELGRLLERAMAERIPVSLEHRYAWDSGHALWLDMRAYPTADGALAVFWRDVTVRKQAEDALRRSEERQAFLLTLSDTLRPLVDPIAIQGAAARLLRERFSVGWCCYAEFDAPGRTAVVAGEAVRGGLPSLAGRHDLSDSPDCVDVLRTGQLLVVPDVTACGSLPKQVVERCTAIGVRALLGAALVRDGRLVALLVMADTTVRPWEPETVDLVREVAQRTGAALQQARTEAALGESETRFRQFGDASPDVLWIRDADTLQWEYLSPAFETIYGVRVAEALHGETFRHWADLIVDEDRAQAVASVRRAARGESVTFDYRVRRVDGRIRWLRDTAFPMRTEGGRVQRIGGVGQDVTDFVQAEHERERGRVLLDAVLSAMPTATMIADATGRPVRWNRAHADLWGVAGRDLSKVDPFDGYAEWKGWRYPEGTPLEPLDWPLSRALRQRATTSGELIEIQPFQEQPRAVVLVVAAPVVGADQQLLGAVVVQTDVTARLRAEEALRRADRQKDVFLATLSHELRNPLAPIRTAVQLLARPGVEAQQTHWAHAVIQRQVTHMALLLDDLLDVSRITQGKLSLKRERVALPAVVDSAVEAARPLIDRKSHHLVVSLPDPPIHLVADPVRLSQVVSNMLTNAAKYTDPGGRIELAARLEAGTVALTVTDTGIGIAPDALPQVFEMFAQVHADRERADGGLGIGLALVKGIVDLHGGTVGATSDGIGCGTTFTVRLPVADDEAARPSTHGDGLRDAGARRKVLIVDDNRDSADTLVMFLQFAGHDIRVAYDGRAGLSLAQAFRPDVALLDIGMPGMDGYALARALRAEPWGQALRLVAMTGWGRDDDRRRSAEAGFDLHLTKPVDPARIEALLAASTPNPAVGS